MTPRFAVSLRRSADPDGGERWQLKDSSPVNFAGGTLADAQACAVGENIEIDPLGLLNNNYRPVDLERHARTIVRSSTDVLNFLEHNSTVFVCGLPECLLVAVIAGLGR